MDIASVTGIQASANRETKVEASTSKGAAAQLDYSAFLKLLIAQMQNQDPLQPMQSSDYVAQLATFSQVEKSVEMNTRMADLLSAVQLQQAGSIIGTNVTSADGEVGGTVVAARIESGNVVAMLADGREVGMGTGVVLAGRDK